MQGLPAMSNGGQFHLPFRYPLLPPFAWSLATSKDYSNREWSCMGQCALGSENSQLKCVEDLLHICDCFPNKSGNSIFQFISSSLGPSWVYARNLHLILVSCKRSLGGWWEDTAWVQVPMPQNAFGDLEGSTNVRLSKGETSNWQLWNIPYCPFWEVSLFLWRDWD